ncbi:MAG TPA: ATP-binding protein [Gaiellaceae bacterium]|nr:ATP-binding protein [Gaiellaceae bacterium]
MDARAAILLVDDRRENLLALEAVLEPLGHRLVSAGSGEEALKELLREEFACILLDVQMPDMDGFETARLIKQRERSQHIPIIFVTAISKDEEHVFRGYSAGAVDYILKPIDPDILRSKIAVFVDVWEKNRQLREQAELLREQQLAEQERVTTARYQQLADAMPQIVWTADPNGNTTYCNRRWFDYTGMTAEDVELFEWPAVVHPDDLPAMLARRTQTLETGDAFEIEFRFRAADGSYRWHLGRAAAIRGDDDAIEFWIGTATDIHDRKRAEEQRRFIVAAGDALSRSLDYRHTLAEVARLAVGGIADWCAVHVVEADGAISELAVAHEDPTQVAFARELEERYPPNPDQPTGAAAVVRTGEPELVAEITDAMLERGARDDLHLDLLRQLDLRSYMCVPLRGRERVLGAITFISCDPGRLFGPDDLQLAEELAGRAVTAIENAQLYREAEERAQAAQVLATIGDGVALVDRAGRVRLWNEAAQRITGLTAGDAIDWQGFARRLRVANAGEAARAETVPLEIDGRELWLSISAVGFEEGTVFAFRDLTEQRALETMRQDLVATVSHELRTPLAAIYGSAVTLRRDDLELEDQLLDKLLEVIEVEAKRLADIVEDLLLTSQLDADKLEVRIERCDPIAIVQQEVETARTHIPKHVELALDVPEALPPVAADPSQLRQVLSNLLDNAVKYSPDGGPIRIEVSSRDRSIRFAVHDRGLGVPAAERERIFEKFYRLDPGMTRGIGGTGLGLYICRELVRRVGGRIWVESEAEGSTFVVEIPQESAGNGANRPKSAVSAGSDRG